MNKWRQYPPDQYSANEVWMLNVEHKYFLRIRRIGPQWYVDTNTQQAVEEWAPINAATEEEAKAVALMMWHMQ